MISPLYERRRRAYNRRRSTETTILYVVFLLFAAEAWDFGAEIALVVFFVSLLAWTRWVWNRR